jgi:hypothetical protein
VVGGEENLPALADYLRLDDGGHLQFADSASRQSLNEARGNLAASQRGHSLVSLAHPGRPRHRFGFLIARAEFPPGLLAIAGSAELAVSLLRTMLVSDWKARCRQASVSLPRKWT